MTPLIIAINLVILGVTIVIVEKLKRYLLR